jgi:hypothetical protein
MSRSLPVRYIPALGASVILLLAGGPSSATAAAPTPGSSPAISTNGCLLRRIDTQLVVCDNLTGAGVRAPLWIPELTSTASVDPQPGCR